MSMQITGTVIAANAALGSLIGQISVVPPHPGLTTYELLVNPSGYFMLSASGGLYVRWMSPAVVGNYVIRVYAHGSGWLEFSSFTIRIVPAPAVATPSKVTLNPSTVSVPDNSAAGTQLSSATVAMSDGSVFSGTLIADNALVAVNGKLLTLSRGLVAADVGLVNVTVIAKQNNVSVTAVLPLTITAHAPPPLPTPTKVVLTPPTISIPDNSLTGTALSTAAVTMSDGSGFTGVLAASDPLVGISGMALKSSRSLTSSDDGVRNVVVTATQNGGSATATLGLTITAVVTPPGISPDGSTISGGTGSLVTADGTWTFGAAAPGRPGEWFILLNTTSTGIAGTLEVNKGGKLYALTVSGTNWYLWQSGAFVPSSDPSPPAPTLNTILNPSSASLQDNTPAGTTLSTASVTMSDGSNPPPLHLTVSDPIVSVSGMTLKTSRGLTSADDGLRDVTVTAVPN